MVLSKLDKLVDFTFDSCAISEKREKNKETTDGKFINIDHLHVNNKIYFKAAKIHL